MYKQMKEPSGNSRSRQPLSDGFHPARQKRLRLKKAPFILKDARKFGAKTASKLSPFASFDHTQTFGYFMQNHKDVQLALVSFKAQLESACNGNFQPQVGVILGTGLSSIVDSGNGPERLAIIPFAKIEGFPVSSVATHAGAFFAGRLNGLDILVQQGRCHLYEGYSPAQICMGVRLMASLGARTLIITNAAGALNPLFQPPSLMLMTDLINCTGLSPLTGANHDGWGERFPDMSEPFDGALRKLALTCALERGIRLEQGVYIGVHGPEMETPAETRMYRQWGADAIGMSSVLEVIAARHMGLKVCGISCIANKNLPDCMQPAPFAKVAAAAERTAGDLAKLLDAMTGAMNADGVLL